MKHYYAEKTPQKFHRSDAFVRGIMGPVGSGKSVACCMEILMRACKQRANDYGIRKSRWAVVRNTYGELRTTTIKTWQDWIPQEICPIVYDSPIRGAAKILQEDGTVVDLEILFIALDRPEHVKKLLSLELTGGWINEAREIPKAILDGLTSRVGRYPNISDGGASWSGVIMDTNPPDTDHWWYRFAEQETPVGWEFFQQPPALIKDSVIGWTGNPEAENICNHIKGYKYYLDMVTGKTEEWIKVYVQGIYGSVIEGKLVYPEYNDDIHSVDYINPIKNVPIVVGFDFGLTPACVFTQLSPRGSFRILDEIATDNMGIKQFMRDMFMPKVNTDFKEHLDNGNIIIIGDPAGNQRAQHDSSATCFDEIAKFGFRAEPAESNAFLTRREAVASFMTRITDGVPSFQLSQKCKQLRKGFLGGYHFARVQVIGDERYKDVPDKNIYSHIQDALQYAALRVERGNLPYNDSQKPSNGKYIPREAGRM